MSTLSFDVFWRDHGGQRGLVNLGKGAEETHGKFSKMKVGIATATAGAAASIFTLGKSAVNAASDINESTTKIQVLFGKSAKSVLDFGNTTASSLGISKASALEAAGTFGNLFVALKLPQGEAAKMSTKLISLAGDMASFNNASPEEVLDAIRSGLVGETEPLRRFGVNMNDATLRTQAMKMGLISNTKEALSPAVKAQAAYGLILAQTGKAQGDFARTSSGAANQARIAKAEFANLQAEIGAKLLPVLVSGGRLLLGVAHYLQENQKWVVPLAVGITTLATTVWAVNKATKAYRATMIALDVVLAANPIGLVIAAIALLVAGLVIAYKKSDTFRSIVQAAFRGVVRAGLDMAGNVVHAAAKAFGWMPGIGPKLRNAARDFDNFKRHVNASLNGISDEKVRISAEFYNHLPRTLYGVRVGGGVGSSRGGITAGMATGGAVRQGSGQRDDVPTILTEGEHVWTRREVSAAGGHSAMYRMRQSVLGMAGGGPVELRDRLNHAMARGANEIGRVAMKSISRALSGGVFNAGLNGALAFARRQVGKPYIWGAVGPNGYDCSGFMSALLNVVQGRNPYQRRFATGSFPSAGFIPGFGSFAIGSRRGNPGHMAGTINGVNVESSGSRGPHMGPSARGARDPMFTGVYHLRGYAGGGVVGDPPFDYLNPNGDYYLGDEIRKQLLMDAGGLFPHGASARNRSGQPERILTGAQNRAFESFVRVISRPRTDAQNGSGSSGIDYDRLADAVTRSLVKADLTVRMDSRAVGSVIGRQADLLGRSS